MNILEYQKNLGKTSIKPINLIHGEEEYLVKTFADRLKEHMPVRILWGDDISLQDLFQEVLGGGMFASRQAFVVYRAQELFAQAKDLKSLSSQISRIKGNMVFFVVPEKLTDKDLQREPYATISRLGDVIAANRLDRRRVRELVKNKLSKEGISIEEEALDFLLEALSYDLMLLKGETDKLILYGSKHLSLEDIKRAVVSNMELSIFDLADGLFLKDPEKALNALHAVLRAGIHPLQVLALMTNYALKAYTAASLVEKGTPVEESLAKVDIKHPFQVMNFKRYLSAHSRRELERLLKLLYLLDVSIKVYYKDPANAIRDFVIEYLTDERIKGLQGNQGNEDRAVSEP